MLRYTETDLTCIIGAASPYTIQTRPLLSPGETRKMAIHPTAVIDPQAKLDATVEVGPYAIIEGPVQIGANSRIRAHAWVGGWTELGEGCDVFPFAVVGGLPQDFHYKGDRSYCRLGKRVVVREGASIHRGSYPESATIIGDDCVFLSTAHAGHNCELGKGVQVQHGALLAGHVSGHDKAIFGAHALIHQFVRVGSLAFIAAGARVSMDVPPFMMCHGETTVVGHNVVGIRRSGCNAEELLEIRQSYRTLYRSGLLFRDAVDRLTEQVKTDAGRLLVSFLQSESKRGFAVGGSHRTRSAGSAGREETSSL